MSRFSRTPGGVLCLCGALAIAIAAGACGGTTPTSPKVDPSVLPAMDVMIADKSLGPANAPNTVIEYSSLTCPHCANFHLQSFPQLKSKYIDAGTVRYTFRDFERSTLDIHAAMLARCAGDRYFDAVDTLFKNQSAWASGDQALASVMRQFGMSQQVIDSCLATTALSDAIVKSRSDGTSLFGVSATPTFVVNENLIVGDHGLAEVEKYLH